MVGQPRGRVGGVGEQPPEGRSVRYGQQEALDQGEQQRPQQEAGQPLDQGVRGVRRETRQDVEQLHPRRRTGDPRAGGARIRHHEADDEHADDGGPGLDGEQGAQRDQRESGGDRGQDGRRALPPGPGDPGERTERHHGEGGVDGHDGQAEPVAAEIEGGTGGGRHLDGVADHRAVAPQSVPDVLHQVAQPAQPGPDGPAGRTPRPGPRGSSLLRAHLSTIGQPVRVRTAQPPGPVPGRRRGAVAVTPATPTPPARRLPGSAKTTSWRCSP